jgi:hypothetical protein
MKINEIVVNEGVISRMIQRNFGQPGTKPGMTFDPKEVQDGVVDRIIQDWKGLVNQYNTAQPGLLSRIYVYQRELDKFLTVSRKINVAGLPRYILAGVDDASVKKYIQQVTAAQNVVNQTRPAPTPTTPAPAAPATVSKSSSTLLGPNGKPLTPTS